MYALFVLRMASGLMEFKELLHNHNVVTYAICHYNYGCDIVTVTLITSESLREFMVF